MGDMFSSAFYKYDKDGYVVGLNKKWKVKKGERLDISLFLLFKAVEKLEKEIEDLKKQKAAIDKLTDR